MDEFNKDKKIILNHFDETILKYKRGPKAVSWGSKNSQLIRFKILSKIGNLNGKTILDVGRGMGDFYGFLINNKKLRLKRYLGIDVNPQMISLAKRKYPKAKFEVRDLLKNSLLKESFDYVLESGIFNLKIPNWEKFTHKVLTQMYKISKIAMGVNFLSALTSFKKNRNSYYADPFEILNFIYNNLSSKFILRHDYKPNDFTIYTYKTK
jgi:ubiquinone/menaquinone biosynthesis C-methylase UbiE